MLMVLVFQVLVVVKAINPASLTSVLSTNCSQICKICRAHLPCATWNEHRPERTSERISCLLSQSPTAQASFDTYEASQFLEHGLNRVQAVNIATFRGCGRDIGN